MYVWPNIITGAFETEVACMRLVYKWFIFVAIEKYRDSCMAIVPFTELKYSECGPVSGLETQIFCVGLSQNRS